MARYLLDTNICVYVMKNEPATIRGRFNRMAEQLAISSVTLGELYFGVEKSGRRAENVDTLEELVARLDVLPFDRKAAAHFGQLRAELERIGKPVGAYDLMIGAQARAEGLIIVTNNMREFERMPGVRAENWV